MDANAPFLALDTETTGLTNQPWCCLVEIGLVYFKGGKEVASFGSLVRPRLEYDERMAPALAVNKLAWDDLAVAPTFNHVWEALGRWLVEHNVLPTAPVVAWNLAFDRGIVQAELQAIGWADRYTVPWGECAMLAHGGREYGHPKRVKLGAAYAALGLPPQEAHRTVGDARMAAHVHVETLRRRAGGKGVVLHANGSVSSVGGTP